MDTMDIEKRDAMGNVVFKGEKEETPPPLFPSPLFQFGSVELSDEGNIPPLSTIP